MGVALEETQEAVGRAIERGDEPTPSSSWALASLAMSSLLAALGTSVANVGLPSLAQAFGVSFHAVQWIVLSYLLAVTTLIVGVGRLGDLVGRRRLLVLGIGLFTVASLACGLTSVLWALIAARGVQGVGAAIMMALSLAMVGDSVPATKTATAMGLLGTMSAVGTALGPSVGGVLLTGFGWRALFFLTVPLGIATYVVARQHLPADPPRALTNLRSFDVTGTVLLALTLAAYALAMTAPNGKFGAHSVALLALGGGGVIAFIRVEARVPTPLVRVAALRDRRLFGGLVANALVATVMMSTLVVGPFYLARALGLDATRVGLVLSVGPLVAAAVGVPAGRVVDRVGATTAGLAGLVGMVAGAVLLTLLPVTSGVRGYLGPIATLTAGYALFQVANNTVVMSGVPALERGMIAGLLSLSRNLGLVTGASVMGAIFALGVQSLGPDADTRTAVAVGMRLTFAAASVLLLFAIGIATRGRAIRAAALALLVIGAAVPVAGQAPMGGAPRAVAPTPVAPYPLRASGWGPSVGTGRFMSRWAEDWTDRRVTGSAPPLKAIPLVRGASLTLSGESRVRHDRFANSKLARGNSFGQSLFRGTVGADARVDRHVRIYTEIATGQVDRLSHVATANFQNNTSLQQLFVDVRGRRGTALFGVMIGRQEFADGPRQLVSVSDGPNVHRTWNGVRLYTHSRWIRLGAFDLRVTRPSPGSFDEIVDRSESLRGVNASVILSRDGAGPSLFFDPFWMRTRTPRSALGKAVTPDARDTHGARLWGQRGPLAIDWTLAHQNGRTDGRPVNAWGAFAVQSVMLSRQGWQPRLELRVDVASGGGARGPGTVREFNPLYASTAYVGEGQFLSLRNQLLIAPGISLAVTPRTRLTFEYGIAQRFDQHDPVYAGGTRVYAGTANASSRSIGELLRVTASHAVGAYVSLFAAHEQLSLGDAMRRTGLTSGSYTQIGTTLRY